MNYPIFFDTKKSLNLFDLKDNFRFISDLYLQQNLPKVLMFSGNKGSGKSTLLNLLSLIDRPSSGSISIEKKVINFIKVIFKIKEFSSC